MRKFAHFIVYSKAAAYIAALLCVVSWYVQVEPKTPASILGLLLSLVTGYLLVRVNREFSLSDTKSILPATLFFMGSALAPDLLVGYGRAMHYILFAVACFVLLRTYRDRDTMGSYFLAFVLIGAQCLMASSLLLTLPFVVLCGAFMESLHVRTFFAALWGLLFPFWVACGVLFLTDRMELVASYLDRVVAVDYASSMLYATPRQWEVFLWALLIVVPSSIGTLLDRTMRLQTSAAFRLMIGVFVVSLVSMALPTSDAAVLLPGVLMVAALFGSAMFVKEGGRAKNVYLVALLLIWLFVLVMPLWNNF